MTSNLGSQYLIDPNMADGAKREAIMAVVVRNSCKPEFLNGLDEIVVFDALTSAELSHIVELQVRQLATRLVDRRITLEMSYARVNNDSVNVHPKS